MKRKILLAISSVLVLFALTLASGCGGGGGGSSSGGTTGGTISGSAG